MTEPRPEVAREQDGDAAAGAIVLRDVSMQFGEVLALGDVSVAVTAGAITGLVGHNGAGKSTLVHLLAGVLLPDAGTVRLFGLDPADGDEGRAVRRRVGFLLEDEALFDYLTGREFLEFIAQAFDLAAEEGRRRIATLIDFCALAGDTDRLCDEYSAGMRKKLAIAAALLPGPSALVLDEPFESLDPAMVRRLSAALRTFAKGGGAVLLSSHLLHVVERVCDRVVFLDHGRVVAERALEARPGANDTARGDLAETYARVIGESIVDVPDWLRGDGGTSSEAPTV